MFAVNSAVCSSALPWSSFPPTGEAAMGDSALDGYDGVGAEGGLLPIPPADDAPPTEVCPAACRFLRHSSSIALRSFLADPPPTEHESSLAPLLPKGDLLVRELASPRAGRDPGPMLIRDRLLMMPPRITIVEINGWSEGLVILGSLRILFGVQYPHEFRGMLQAVSNSRVVCVALRL